MNWVQDQDSDTAVWQTMPGKAAVRRMECVLADHCGRTYSLATCSATMGLWAVFRALGVAGGEVIVPAITWPASLSGLLELGCTLRFCDVETDTGNMDPDCLKQLIRPETLAVLTVDLWGYPCRLDDIREVCDDHGIWLVHDAAQSFGSYYMHAQSGNFADLAVYSFGEGKLFSAGEGGCILTDREDVYKRLLHLAAHPNRQLMELTTANPFPVNINMHPLTAQHIISQLDAALSAIRKRSAGIRKRLAAFGMEIDPATEPNFHRVVLPGEIAKAVHRAKNDALQPIPYDEPVYALLGEAYAGVTCPIAEQVIREHKRILWD